MIWFSCCVFFFFFKQKTAYEMRISDWSSDVCSSDLQAQLVAGGAGGAGHHRGDRLGIDRRQGLGQQQLNPGEHEAEEGGDADAAADQRHEDLRSEAHTSELQSLMRISYAVFGLNKNIMNTSEQKVTQLLAN